MIKSQLGKKITPILEELENTLLEHEARQLGPAGLDENALRASLKIFLSCLLEHMWNRQRAMNMPARERLEQALELGKAIREMILKYTGKDSYTFYESNRIDLN